MYNETIIRPTESRLWKVRMGLTDARPTLAELQFGEGFLHQLETPSPDKVAFKTGKKRRQVEASLDLDIEPPDVWLYVNAKAEYYRYRGFHRTNEMPPPETFPGVIHVRKMSKKLKREKLKWKKKIAKKVEAGARV